MNKDIIYIDVEDDITAIIGKIKASKDKIIALVPPKRVGVLQSAVNLRLLNRMAQTNNKRLVLITNNQALVALSANIGIPVAKNLQSKPELPEISALDIDEGEDVIDGASLPVGDHAKVGSKKKDEDESVEEAIETIDIDDKSVDVEPEVEEKPKTDKKLVKVPDFSAFRKKLFFGIGGGVLLIAFLIWANIFAPSARVIVTAKTSPTSVSTTVTLGGNADTDVAKGVIKTVSQELKKDISVDFDVTGEKDLGNKATGTLRVSKLTQSSQAVPAGSKFTASGGLIFVTQEAVTIPASVPCFPTYCAQAVDVAVAAENGGTNYNGVSGTASGPNGVNGTFQGSTSGGTTKLAKVPTKQDIQTASGKLILPTDDEVKSELIAKFVNGEVVINDSFASVKSDPVSSPKEGEESTDGKAKITVSITYTITAVPKADIQLYLKSELDKQLTNKTNQKVYSDGVDEVSLTEYTKKDTSATVKIVTSAKVGPSISEADIKSQVKGKIYGDAQAALESIEGVVDADVKFSYFWVRSVPGSDNKISVEFKLQDE